MSNKLKIFAVSVVILSSIGLPVAMLHQKHAKHAKQVNQASIPKNLKRCFEMATLFKGDSFESDLHGSASSSVDKTQSGNEVLSHSSGKIIEGVSGKMWVTVAHALYDLEGSKNTLKISVKNETLNANVKDSYCHKDYDPSTLNNDIAFVPIQGEPPFQEFKENTRKVNVGEKVVVYASGFSGISEEGVQIGQLRKADFEVISIDEQSIQLKSIMKDVKICSGDSGSMVEDAEGYNVGIIKSVIPEEDHPPCGETAYAQVIAIGD